MDSLHLSRDYVFILANPPPLWELSLLALPLPPQAVVYQLPHPQSHPLHQLPLHHLLHLLAPPPLLAAEEEEEAFASLGQAPRTTSGCVPSVAIMATALQGHVSVMHMEIQSLLHPQLELMECQSPARMILTWVFVVSHAIMDIAHLLRVGRFK
jgi:hypothetical protein